jgi:hypothetical protein
VEKEKKKKKGKKPAKVKETDEPLIYPFHQRSVFESVGSVEEIQKGTIQIPYKHSGEQAALKNVGEISRGNMEVALAIIQQSMAHGWKGLFELTTGNQPTTPAEAAEYAARVNSMK